MKKKEEFRTKKQIEDVLETYRYTINFIPVSIYFLS